jgi:glutaredoxin
MTDQKAADDMVARTNQMGVPVFIINDKDILIGFNRDKLDKMLF